MVEGRAFGNIVTDIGNVNTQTIGLIIENLERHGIVVIARIGRINGKTDQIAQIEATVNFLCGNTFWNRLCSFENMMGKFEWKTAFFNKDKGLNTRIVRIAQNFDNPPIGMGIG